MKRVISGALIPIIWTLYFQAAVAYGDGRGNVSIHLNGGCDVAYINEVNTLEIWVANDAELNYMLIPLEITFATALSWDMDYGGYPPVNEEGRASGCWQPFLVYPEFDNVSPDYLEIGGYTLEGEYGGLDAGWGELCYSLQFYIPPTESPTDDGISIVPSVHQLAAIWQFGDSTGYYPPDFNGYRVASIIDPVAPPVTFDIVRRNICGDANCDYEVNIADAVYTINYVFKGGPPPCANCP